MAIRGREVAWWLRSEGPGYAGGIDLELPLDKLLRQTDDNLEPGFRAIKMKVGRAGLSSAPPWGSPSARAEADNAAFTNMSAVVVLHDAMRAADKLGRVASGKI